MCRLSKKGLGFERSYRGGRFATASAYANLRKSMPLLISVLVLSTDAMMVCHDSFLVDMQRNGSNIRTLREFSLVEKLLSILKSPRVPSGSPSHDGGDHHPPPPPSANGSNDATTLTLLNVIHALLCTNPRVTDVLCFALFTAATLNPCAVDENKVKWHKFKRKT